MEYISATEKSMLLVPYIILFLSILAIFCMNQLKNQLKN